MKTFASLTGSWRRVSHTAFGSLMPPRRALLGRHAVRTHTQIGAGHDSDLAYLFQWDDFAGKKPEFAERSNFQETTP